MKKEVALKRNTKMEGQPMLSVIIPVLDEAGILAQRIKALRDNLKSVAHELVISDGGSTDGSEKIAKALADCYVTGPAGRARQLNAGAEVASGEWFYFLHADTTPPDSLADWLSWMETQKRHAACFKMRFDQKSWALNALGYCTRFNIDAFRFGDQSLLVKRTAFLAIDGYDESFILMEGNDIVRRLKKHYDFTILADYVITSARKYQRFGTLYVQGVYTLIYCLQRLGVPQKKLYEIYQRCFERLSIC